MEVRPPMEDSMTTGPAPPMPTTPVTPPGERGQPPPPPKAGATAAAAYNTLTSAAAIAPATGAERNATQANRSKRPNRVVRRSFAWIAAP